MRRFKKSHVLLTGGVSNNNQAINQSIKKRCKIVPAKNQIICKFRTLLLSYSIIYVKILKTKKFPKNWCVECFQWFLEYMRFNPERFNIRNVILFILSDYFETNYIFVLRGASSSFSSSSFQFIKILKIVKTNKIKVNPILTSAAAQIQLPEVTKA